MQRTLAGRRIQLAVERRHQSSPAVAVTGPTVAGLCIIAEKSKAK
jgi:hypothetical protein